MMSKASLDRDLTIYLERKYNKVFLSSAEVERETLTSAISVPSTSDKADTWLLRDIVEFINKPFYNKELNKMDKKTKKSYVIQHISSSLDKIWENMARDTKACHIRENRR
ncbi:MAG: hypothetical protein QG567_1627 [Campylobacterota bacterium]|nr:hypothetical protein [Campylobacterota bacterium]